MKIKQINNSDHAILCIKQNYYEHVLVVLLVVGTILVKYFTICNVVTVVGLVNKCGFVAGRMV